MRPLLSSSRRVPKDYLDVTKAPYSATGNGVTDDRAAIQAAIDAAAAGATKVVYFPSTPNFYAIGGVLNYKTGVTLRGASAITSAIVNLQSRANSDTTMAQPNTTAGTVTGVVIERLTWHQAGDYFDATFGDDTNAMCISIEATHNTIIRDCYFRYVRTMAVWCDSAIANPTTGAQFIRNHIFQAGGDGFSSFGEFTDAVVSDNIIENTEDDAIAFQDSGGGGTPKRITCARNTITNCNTQTTYGSTPRGILIQGGSNISVTNNTVDRTFGSTFLAYSNVGTINALVITGNYFGHAGSDPLGTNTSTPGYGYWIQGAGANPITFTNNVIDSPRDGISNIVSSTNVGRSGNTPPP